MMNLSGKTIIVTGAARGIGAAAAEACTLAGAQVVGVDRDAVPGGIVVDLSDQAAPGQVLAETVERFGKADGLVNAAGVTTRASFLSGSASQFDAIIAVNLRAPFLLMSELIRHLVGRGAAGSVVNIQSMNAHCGAADLAIYAASKGGLQVLTKNAAAAHMADRIRVNGINLGWVDTPTERAFQDAEHGADWFEEQALAQPLRRFVSSQDCARQVVWMLSDASAPMTGVSVDLEQAVVGAL